MLVIIMKELVRNIQNDSTDKGVEALMRAAQEGMSEQDKFEQRKEYLAQGCSLDTANKLFPDLPPVQ